MIVGVEPVLTVATGAPPARNREAKSTITSGPACAEPDPPGRIWDGDSWIESMTIRRDNRGQFTDKRGNEPKSRLDQPGLFDQDEAA